MSYTAAVITVSDKGSRGERRDTSGPAIRSILEQRGWQVVHTAILPDEAEEIRRELIRCADEEKLHLVLTTGGTGFSPRDVTPEATLSVVERLVPGLPEAMRWESLKITPRGCLSRGAAGIRGRTLILNLPGSEKAARENLLAVIDAVGHGLEMLLGSGSADCAAPALPVPAKAPSMDQWLREAKADPRAGQVGMYLFHCGAVRETPRARVREGDLTAPPVTVAPARSTQVEGALASFGLSLLQGARQGREDGTLVSPLSAALALSMAANGAQGDTLAQFQSVVGGGAGLEELNAACTQLMADYQSLGGSTRCSIANSLWVDPE